MYTTLRATTVFTGVLREHQTSDSKHGNNIRENACCIVNRSAGSRNIETFPAGLKLAVFGIFNTVIFVYITVEGKPLFG